VDADTRVERERQLGEQPRLSRGSDVVSREGRDRVGAR
jgi:hypothetical protein